MVDKGTHTEQMARARAKWDAKNPEKRAHIQARSAARGFIRKRATLPDLDELTALIDARRKELK
ncbi:hypothetical protein [Lactiplantibacillus modestisalitolerans]|uniref:Uncharacterized protein n=1 Tax=Lactiplantibacillus modestisalitolerans TaxID=1457219 RepID=A0ABV5WRH6_9LACO|nr:hypothetical protein [Lactiplantibacillus modestisalitolerans]